MNRVPLYLLTTIYLISQLLYPVHSQHLLRLTDGNSRGKEVNLQLFACSLVRLISLDWMNYNSFHLSSLSNLI